MTALHLGYVNAIKRGYQFTVRTCGASVGARVQISGSGGSFILSDFVAFLAKARQPTLEKVLTWKTEPHVNIFLYVLLLLAGEVRS